MSKDPERSKTIKNMPSDVYVTRHAQRADKSRNWTPLAGHSVEDCELSTEGEEASLQLTKKFEGIELSHIVSSPFLRCIQTVLPLAIAKGIEIKIEPGIGEVECKEFWNATRLASEKKFPVDLNFKPVLSRDDLGPEWGDSAAAR